MPNLKRRGFVMAVPLFLSGCLELSNGQETKVAPRSRSRSDNKSRTYDCENPNELWLRKWEKGELGVSEEVLNPLQFSNLPEEERRVINEAIDGKSYISCGQGMKIYSIADKANNLRKQQVEDWKQKHQGQTVSPPVSVGMPFIKKEGQLYAIYIKLSKMDCPFMPAFKHCSKPNY
jgi:hypothetical protein